VIWFFHTAKNKGEKSDMWLGRGKRKGEITIPSYS
jgi:hypothetical protein